MPIRTETAIVPRAHCSKARRNDRARSIISSRPWRCHCWDILRTTRSQRSVPLSHAVHPNVGDG
eukprot:5659430-Alexandrium_andersonii.AAC.1